jgi:hypothetical protein
MMRDQEQCMPSHAEQGFSFKESVHVLYGTIIFNEATVSSPDNEEKDMIVFLKIH